MKTFSLSTVICVFIGLVGCSNASDSALKQVPEPNGTPISIGEEVELEEGNHNVSNKNNGMGVQEPNGDSVDIGEEIDLNESALFPVDLHQIDFARMDATGKYIVIKMVHGGGCGDHIFNLELQGGCLERLPVKCTVKLTHKTNDVCEALESSIAVFSLKDLGMDDSYFSRATVNIIADGDFNVRLNLPELK